MANEAIKVWYDLRKKAIHERVAVHDILRSNGIVFRHSGDREEQFSCPFHGKDEKPSARVFPTNAQSPSHVWCYVCREWWDVIGLWKKYHGGDGKSFHRILSEIERYYNIPVPPVPEGAFAKGPSGDEKQKLDFDHLYQACEERLTSVRDSYVMTNDMKGYLVAGSIMDKVSYQITEGLLGYPGGIELLKKLMQKIGERVRGVPTGQITDS